MGERIISWFLRCRGIWHEFSIPNRISTNCFKIPRLHPHETQFIPYSSYAILRNAPFQHQCDDSSQLIGGCGDSFDSIAIESCHRTKSTTSSTHRLGQFRLTAIQVESEWIVSAIGSVSRDSMASVTRSMIILLGWELALSVGTYDYPIPRSHATRMCTLISSVSIQLPCLFCQKL